MAYSPEDRDLHGGDNEDYAEHDIPLTRSDKLEAEALAVGGDPVGVGPVVGIHPLWRREEEHGGSGCRGWLAPPFNFR